MGVAAADVFRRLPEKRGRSGAYWLVLRWRAPFACAASRPAWQIRVSTVWGFARAVPLPGLLSLLVRQSHQQLAGHLAWPEAQAMGAIHPSAGPGPMATRPAAAGLGMGRAGGG
jgi:hypothetical protein